MSKHIQTRRPAPSLPPPTHPPNVQQWKAFTCEEEFLQETCKQDEILRERHFAKKGFWEKDNLRERDFERKGFWEKNPIHGFDESVDWFSKSLNPNWSFRESSDSPNSLAAKEGLLLDPILGRYMHARAQISWICKFGVLRYVHRTDRHKINKFNKKEWNTKIKCIISKFYNK